MKKSLKIILGILGCIVILVVGGILGFMIQDNNYKATSNDYYSPVYDDYTNDYATAGVTEESYYDSDLFPSSEYEDEKLVYSGRVNIGSDDISKSYAQLANKIKEYEAKIENLTENSSYKSITLRVHKDKFMTFYNSLSEIEGTITDANIEVDNYTKYYKDNERRIDILKTEYDELKDLMKNATEVEDILSIKDRLSYITYELESLTQSNNEIDYDVEYSTLVITLRKVGNNIIEDTPFSRQIKDAFKNSINIIKTIILGLISIWWLILLIVIVIIIVKYRRKRKN